MATASNDACVCGCRDGASAAVHAIAAALAQDDLDRAITLGLMAVEPLACAGCSDDCRARLQTARDERMQALAARDRYRARNARLERRARERAEHRASALPAAAMPVAAGAATDAPAPAATSLPSAAAAALARARAKAAARHKP